ncbi:hypothetical protein BDW42DRAFT_67470 [Aspergillus taichungensis]|uniref:Uncharacterized protein n=1 Tax=Aspergillus taichungensis TaxID=482145 RepID=A0A2J5I0X6_9EURO|nr:hypothetical protein BDW42DRAFT_67470 [Aspergillus taichungensis]
MHSLVNRNGLLGGNVGFPPQAPRPASKDPPHPYRFSSVSSSLFFLPSLLLFISPSIFARLALLRSSSLFRHGCISLRPMTSITASPSH